MPRYMLDTDTCSYIMKRSHPIVLKRLQAVPVSDVCMSIITKAELLYGVEVSPRRSQDAAQGQGPRHHGGDHSLPSEIHPDHLLPQLSLVFPCERAWRVSLRGTCRTAGRFERVERVRKSGAEPG